MAITRRQFVTRLGALAAAAGLGQADVSRLSEAFAYANWPGGKPKVVWVHGAECTGCSTSLLGLYEDATGIAIEGTGTTTLAALRLATGVPGLTGDDLTLHGGAGLIGAGNTIDFNDAIGEDSTNVITIQDVLVDIIELDYHETVMNMGGDLAAQWLHNFMSPANTTPFVLVVEGAVQDKDQGGAWTDTAGNGKPWCSIGMSDNYNGTVGFDLSFDEVVKALAAKATCPAVISIGQCASFGGYPGCVSPLAESVTGFKEMSQTDAKGVYDFLYDDMATRAYAAKVINVPGCPANPWWFILTVVAWLVDARTAVVPGLQAVPQTNTDGALGILAAGGAIKASAVDSTRRLKAVYPYAIHGPFCPRYNDYSIGKFAEKPGDPGCLQKIGCKGMAVKSLCGAHGWNAQQPHNDSTWDYALADANPVGTGFQGGHCTRSGHPCMGCTEKGYPDSFVPFVNW